MKNLSRDWKPWKGGGLINAPFSSDAESKSPVRWTAHIIAPGFNPGNKAQPHLKESCKDDAKERTKYTGDAISAISLEPLLKVALGACRTYDNLLRKTWIWPDFELFFVNRSTIRLKRPQNLSQTSLFSLQFPKSDRLLGQKLRSPRHSASSVPRDDIEDCRQTPNFSSVALYAPPNRAHYFRSDRNRKEPTKSERVIHYNYEAI